MPIASASRSWSAASGGPSVSTTDSPPFASMSRTASSTRAFLVRADDEPEEARVDRPPVVSEDDPAAGRRNALDADEDAHR